MEENDYKYGFKNKDVSILKTDKGLSEEIVREISKLKNEPDRTPSNRTIKAICQVFKVDEVWLRTGIGNPNIKKSRKEELNAIFSDALEGVSDKDKFLRAVASVPDSAFPALVEFIRTLSAELGE